MLNLTFHPEGCLVPVKAQPGGRKNAITGVHAGLLKVTVTAAPEKGKANRAIAELLAKSLGLAKSSVELVAGPTSGEKKFLLNGMTVEAATEKFAEIVGKLS